MRPHQCCTSLNLLAMLLLMHLGVLLPSLPWGLTVASRLAWCPPEPPGPSQQSSFPGGWPPARPGARGCSSPGAGLCAVLCWTLWDFFQPISPVCAGPSGWQHNPLVYQLLLLVLYHLYTVQVANEDAQWYWTQCGPLGYTSSDWPPAGLSAADHNPQRLAVQLDTLLGYILGL